LKNNYLPTKIGNLDGKFALVTNESESIHLAAIQRFLAESVYVFITERRKKKHLM